ncbi:hypothetical protein B296_00056543 [Ensete ventricosum]|uniref:Uncharacterized protein n=1 Tax=Ensete ventricosum TaxID=4639 RepID=A0A426XB52_ENSVE|nr:hypothetical protein B296_00056543 [Ensete ventricosum]
MPKCPSPFQPPIALPPPLLATSSLLPSHPVIALIFQLLLLFLAATTVASYRPASSSTSSVTVAGPALSSWPHIGRVSSDTPIPLLPPRSTSSSSSPVTTAFRCPVVLPPP